MITIVDNYDSFTYNLVQQIERIAGERLRVIRNDAFEPHQLLAERPRAIVISPGPGIPSRAGRSIDLIRANQSIPLLGVCLGHQAIGEAFGAAVVRGPLPVHGKVTPILHRGERLFAGCESPLQAARYHSLVIDAATLPDDLAVDAETDDGVIMAISHRTRPIFGVQFHPESYGTSGGDQIIRNFLAIVEDQLARARPDEGTSAASSSKSGMKIHHAPAFVPQPNAGSMPSGKFCASGGQTPSSVPSRGTCTGEAPVLHNQSPLCRGSFVVLAGAGLSTSRAEQA